MRLTLDQYHALPRLVRGLHASAHQREQHKHKCGHDIEVCADPDKTWYPARQVCHVAMEEAAAEWRYEKAYGGKFHDGTFKKWADEQSDGFPYGHRDGLTIFVAEVKFSPEDDWLPPPVRGDSPI